MISCCLVFLIEWEPNNDCFYKCPFLVNLLVLFRCFIRLQLNISKESIFWDYYIKIILFNAKDFYRHNHVPFECIWSFLKKIIKNLIIFHDSFFVSWIFKSAHDLSFYQLIIETSIILYSPINSSSSLRIFKYLK